MVVKTTGAELKRFWASPLPDDQWFEDEIIVVDGKQFDALQDDVHGIADEASVTLEGGFVAHDPKERSVEAVFKAWRKAQNTITLNIEFPRTDEARVLAALKGLGIKVSGQ